MGDLSLEEFSERITVSRETAARLDRYLSLLRIWQKRINLVGARTLSEPWRRHMLDSAQLWPIIQSLSTSRGGEPLVVDLGSGAGFPGLVLAILGGVQVHLIESDARKCAFLRTVADATETPVAIHARRAEDIDPTAVLGPRLADWVTARACAPLPRLLELAHPFLAPQGRCLFHKGARWAEELTEAKKTWKIASECLPSMSHESGVLLKITELSPDGL
ncbi:MAG: 16S rRNA (guanine(527)-N(7))-methyltransferase RsmG [Alphaproteobacteria bacterium]|nr:16S rRNA (guanine(527)-N(7))-methyltransferase RsmG [Alphaproteobacteria bacterium]